MGIGRWIAAGLGIAAVGAVAAYAKYSDTEQAPYKVVVEDGEFELREYPPIIVAQVTHTGESMRARNASFRRLAAYIFGQDRPRGGDTIAMTAPVMTARVGEDEKIAMTAPVLQDQTGSDTWRMRFVMPAKYTLETLPAPPTDIALTELPARRMAAVRFSGNAREAQLIEMEAKLMNWIEGRGLAATGNPEYAGYDAPMVPGPMRRNEVMIEVAAE
ncbi:SOUL family heme-binding protein [Erythrobacter rubeus]|uniref:Heme-binding protein n=1 Tax=Erythrobacter rubeus TaxID=2760803 RepID=A0ABR8KPS9_9SPHN|nr:heme-binding protein [Erythrobacter rubeus]MBD2841295.1 heme-binding protein [Erythrobacter rubeus]